jgi:hypothetical protein
MSKLKKLIALVFLAIFVLVKISPDYYRYQLLPALSTGNSALEPIHYGTCQNANFLIRIQKGIVENDTFKIVPEIKFSGFLFALMFLGAYLISPGTYQNLLSFKYSICKTKKYILQSVLRL